MQQVTTTKQPKKSAAPIVAPSTTPDTEIQPVISPGQSTALTTIAEVEAVLDDAVATQTMPTTPPTPDLVGADVFIRPQHNGLQRWPGTSTYDYKTEDRKIDAVAFTRGRLDFPEDAKGSLGILPVHEFPYAPATELKPGTWHWRTEVI